MISDDVQYEHLTATVTERTRVVYDSFKLFLQLFSITVGGAIGLSLQIPPTSPLRASFITLSNILVGLLAFVTAVMVFENMRSWYRYRHAIANLYTIPPPTVFPSLIAGMAMMASMIVATMLFWAFNPFSIV